MKKIFPVFDTVISKEDISRVVHCLESGWVSTAGEYTRQFEGKLGNYLSVNHVCATSSGTSALHLALLISGVKKGDLVLVPSLTFMASVNAITYCQAHPVFLDVDPHTLNVSLEDLKKAIYEIKQNQAVSKHLLLVHLLGHCQDLDSIMELCQEEKIFIIEDAAQALGSFYKNKALGTFGMCGVTSFNGNKIITSSAGGAVFSNSAELIEKANLLAQQGKVLGKDYIHEEIGYNYKMPGLNASLGLSQLERIEKIKEKKSQIHNTYARGFKGSEKIRIIEPLPHTKSNFWVNAIEIMKGGIGFDLEQSKKRLRGKGIHTQTIYFPVHMQNPYQKVSIKRNLTQSEKIFQKILFLPSYETITQNDQNFIIENIMKELKN